MISMASLNGSCSTHDYATLKVYTRQGLDNSEVNAYKSLRTSNPSHPGYEYVRTAVDSFTIQRQNGDHRCLVQKPMWDSFKDLLNRNPTHRFTEELLRTGLTQVFLALSYLHSECKLVHTGNEASLLKGRTNFEQTSRPTTSSWI